MTIRPVPAAKPRFDRNTLRESLRSIIGSEVDDVAFSPLLGDASDRKYFRVTFRTGSSGNQSPSILLGDASDRKYFRVTFRTGSLGNQSSSMIVMQLQEPVPQKETDFTRILKFLQTLDLPVPELFHYDLVGGLLFLEDCGQPTMEDWVRKHPGDKAAYYRQAVELLAGLHQRATKNIDSGCPAYHRKFDVAKLMWELDFMLEHYVRRLKKSSLNERETDEVRRRFLSLSETLAAQEPTFTHRDYHSRNLMVKDGGLILLDFQDARMGPCQYDLASLLKDSYVRLEDGFRNEMIERYIKRKERQEVRSVDRREFLRIFEWTSIQRNLKAVGTFAYQSVVKGNHRYLEYIPQTLDYVKQTLDARPELLELKQTLTQYLPGLVSENAKGK